MDYNDALLAAAVEAAHKQTDVPKDRIIAVPANNGIAFLASVMVLGGDTPVSWLYNHQDGGLHSGFYGQGQALAGFLTRAYGRQYIEELGGVLS